MKILTQPDLVTCGPTCLHAIYAYYQDTLSLDNVISQIEYLASGGTLAAFLGSHALKRGYQVTMHSVNVHLLDPTWFKKKKVNLLEKLKKQSLSKTDPKSTQAIEAYIQFVELGGMIKFSDFNFGLLEKYLKNKIPLLSGVDAPYFYQTARDGVNQKGNEVYDEFGGNPSGHFIVIYDYEAGQNLCIADPYIDRSISPNHYYKVTYNRWLHSLLLGITTFDSELLVIEPKSA